METDILERERMNETIEYKGLKFDLLYSEETEEYMVSDRKGGYSDIYKTRTAVIEAIKNNSINFESV